MRQSRFDWTERICSTLHAKGFFREYPMIQLKIKKTGGIYNDRFIVLDYGTEEERIFLCGASSKDAGARVTCIVEDFGTEKYKGLLDELLKNQEMVLV